jgi:hypothetical protein
VENDAERMPPSGADFADSMPVLHAIEAACAADRPVASGEDHGIALAERDDPRDRRPARQLVGEDEITAGLLVGD